MSGRRGLLVAAAAIVVAAGALAIVAARGSGPPGDVQAQARAVASGLRCPVCQNLSVADSPSPLAQQMRATIARGLEAGKPPERIRAEFVAAYGEWILLAPPRRGINLIAWIAPLLLVLGGLMAAALAVRRWSLGAGHTAGSRCGATPAPAEAALSNEDRRRLRRALDGLEEEPV